MCDSAHLTGFSFPSSHAISAAVGFLLLAFFIEAETRARLWPSIVAWVLTSLVGIMNVMATTMLTWTRDLYDASLLTQGSQIWGMTSAGETHVMDTYGAVSMAKAALAAITRQLAFELAQDGLSFNLIRAGVTRSPALLKIPGHVAQTRKALAQNPSRRLTVGKDVADVVAALAPLPELWLNGDIINVDGGEVLV